MTMQSMSNLDYLEEVDAIRLVQLSYAGGRWNHVVILHKAECFVTDPYKRLRVAGEVLVWLSAYCSDNYEVKSIEMKANVIDQTNMTETGLGFEGKIYFVAFAEENDAFHFKMRWGGRA